jgi:hypothetical protein
MGFKASYLHLKELSVGGMTLAGGKPWYWEKRTCQVANLSATNFRATGLGPNPGLPGEVHEPESCYDLDAPCSGGWAAHKVSVSWDQHSETGRYIHTYIHTYTHTYIHTYIHAAGRIKKKPD